MNSMDGDITNELLKALVTATAEQKQEALRLLRGKSTPVSPEPRIEPYVTLREVGKRLGISPCSLWRWGVPGHQLGGRRRFRLSEVVAYLESPAFKARARELREERKREG